MKRWSFVAVAVLAACLSAAAFGASHDVSGRNVWEEVFARYGMRTVDTVPVGVTPLQIDSPAELARLIQHVAVRGGRSTVETLGAPLLAYGLTESCVHLHATKSWVPFPTFNLWAEVWIAGSGSFWEIRDVYEWVGLTGITIIADLTDTWTYHRIATDRQSVTIRGGGVVNHYFIIKSILKVYSQPVELTIFYSLR